ncbi:MAG: thioredoxin [Porticoccaceae bacterium]|nr:MAG: thioredoxin [Porticoccaceae bacterium]
MRAGFFLAIALALAACSRPSPFPGAAEGQVVVVNYWAEWCEPCREEIPALNAFARRHAGEVVLYGVNFDGAQGEALARLERQLGIEFPTLAEDPGPRLGWPVPRGLPHTRFTDPSGRRLLELAGAQTEASLEAALARFRAGEGAP